MAPEFFERLDELLPGERTAAGGPSATDFLLHDIPAIIDRLAEDYEGVTMAVEGHPGVRVLVAAGYLVPYLSIYTAVAADGAIEMFYLDIDN